MKTKNVKKSKNVAKNVKIENVKIIGMNPNGFIDSEFSANESETVEILNATNETAEITEQTTKPVVKREKTGICKLLVDFFTPLIAENKYTQQQLLKISVETLDKFNVVTAQTLLVDSKNPKYNKFGVLVVKNENGVLSFAQ